MITKAENEDVVVDVIRKHPMIACQGFGVHLDSMMSFSRGMLSPALQASQRPPEGIDL